MSNRHLSSWPPKVPRELGLPETSLWYNLEVSARRFPSRAAVVFYDSQLTYRELFEQAERLAGYLQQHCGVQRGDRVALYMQNCPQFVISYYAVLRADAVVVPVNPMNLAGELAYMLHDSGARVLIAAQDLLKHALSALPVNGDLQVLAVAYSDYLTEATNLSVPENVLAPRDALQAPRLTTWTHAMKQASAPAAHRAQPEDLCVMPYTSGTTGHPKGCMHTHRSVMHTALATPCWYRHTQGEITLTVLPLFHVTGMQNSMNAPIYLGGTMVMMARWDRQVAAELIQRYRVTGFTSVPTMVVDLLSMPDIDRYDLSSVQSMGGGGAAMPEAIASKLEQLCGLSYVEGYGLSETMAATHINPTHKPKKQCLGIPTFGVDSRVVNPETLEELAPGEIGEIITHGPQLFEGYWNKPDANAACFVERDGKRFFRTGDLARCDEEGYFFLVDRLKRMINVSGFKVWPAEVESMLYAHPAIKEATVIATRDARRGEMVKALVVLHDAQRGQVGEEQLLAWARTQMAAYKVPRAIELVTELPKSGSGKILWRVLQEQEDQRTGEKQPLRP